MTVREKVYGLLSSDAELIGLGFTEENWYANGGPDSPPEGTGDVWAVLNWGEELPGLRGQRGYARRSNVWTLTVWFYTRQQDFGVINAARKRAMVMLEAVESVSTGGGPDDGQITCITWQGDSPDGWDEAYRANFRNSTYTIVANGD